MNNNLQIDEDIIGYYDFHLPNLFVPNVNYYLYDEEKCEELIEKYFYFFHLFFCINNLPGGS